MDSDGQQVPQLSLIAVKPDVLDKVIGTLQDIKAGKHEAGAGPTAASDTKSAATEQSQVKADPKAAATPSMSTASKTAETATTTSAISFGGSKLANDGKWQKLM